MADSTPTFRGYTLYPFQQGAIEAIRGERSVIVAAPTGAGKTLVADFAIERSFNRGERIVYTSPVKALSNQKFRDFRAEHGDAVGIMTGDVTINPDAPLLIMTTEVFRNTIFEDPRRVLDTRWVIFDEVHYIDDLDRGTVWEESIIFAPKHVDFICLSATVPNVRELADWMEQVRQKPIDVVESFERPVPLSHFIEFEPGRIYPLKDARQKIASLRRKRLKFKPDREGQRLLDTLVKRDLLPVIWFCFSRKDCEKLAAAHGKRRLLTDREHREITGVFDDLCERYQLPDSAGTARLRAMASRGVLYHHAGLLPIHKEIVERLFNTGLVKLLFATETFALGVNMPARTVAFQMLKKFDGVAMNWLRTRDYFQMAGRAGRQGIDTVGQVVSRLDLRWDDPAEAERVIRGKVEPVMSRFNLSYSGLLSLYDRLGADHLTVAYERSFAKFQHDRAKGKKQGKGGRGKGRRGRGQRKPREALRIGRRLAVLERTGYIDENGLTKKGRFAEFVNGYEVHAAELYSIGVFHLASEIQLAVLMVAIIYEARKADSSPRVPPSLLGEIKGLAEDRIREFRGVEFDEGLVLQVKELDFRLSVPTRDWMQGAPLDRIKQDTSVSEGDLVRQFRMAIQLMRQIRSRVKGDGDLADRFAAAIELMDRDEVDARRQLELG